VNPFVAVLLGTLVLGEPLGWRTLVGGAVVIAAVALIVRAPRATPEPEPAAGARRPAAATARGS
jgi:drug/metabolite transporter (DMT)-like permease